MDLVRQLKNVRFDISVRGYDCAGVDTFLATLRSEVGDLQALHKQAQQRIAELEESGGGSSETEGTLRRTLVLAQRLADETEAEAAAAAKETVTAATKEAEDLRTDAELAAAEKRQAAEEELATAQSQAMAMTDAATSEAEQARSQARQGAQELLEAAEATGADRVQEIEALAREEAASMREPVREEVEQLEGVRTRLLGDIADLEAHLEAQRVRVRTAVEALRAGMSGSIQDLEKVAEDDSLMAPEPAPEHSAASSDDVAVAPEIEIADAVSDQASETTPTVESLEAEVDASMAAEEVEVEPAEAIGTHATTEDDGSDLDSVDELDMDLDAGPPTELIEVVEAPEADSADSTMSEVVVEDVPVSADTAEVDVVETDVVDDVIPDAAAPEPDAPAEVSEADVSQDTTETGAAAGAAAVVGGSVVGGALAGRAMAAGKNQEMPEATATAAELEEAELVVLDDEPDALFGTDLGADAEAIEPDAETISEEPSAEVDLAGNSFINALAESLDQLPVER